MSTRAVEFLAPLGFGRADVVVAVPDCWIDVGSMADLEDVAAQFARVHGRRLRVATKYMNLTRRFFARQGVTGYRIVESVGATEATPAAGTAELIVDITTTGTTLRANHLKVLDDGLILKSQAHLFASRAAPWDKAAMKLRDAIVEKLSVQPDTDERDAMLDSPRRSALARSRLFVADPRPPRRRASSSCATARRPIPGSCATSASSAPRLWR